MRDRGRIGRSRQEGLDSVALIEAEAIRTIVAIVPFADIVKTLEYCRQRQSRQPFLSRLAYSQHEANIR